MKNHIDLAIFILFYEKVEQTIECINSFLPSDVSIYVLNNGSSTLSRRLLGSFSKKYKQIKIFDSNANLGAGGGRNYLITHTTEEWFLSVDNDIVMKTDDWLPRFVEHIFSTNKPEVLVPKLFVVHNNSYANPCSYRIEHQIAFSDETIMNDMTNTFPGGASFINRRLFNRLGLYDDKLFALEDYELCLRGIISGNQVKAKMIDDIELVHDHRPATNKLDRKAAMQRYNVSNVERSYKMITARHGITIKDHGKIGTIYNLEYMLNSYNPLSSYFWKKFIPRPIKRSLKDFEARMRGRTLPTFCNLFMTDRCNLGCPWCRRRIVGINKAREMALPTIQRLLSIYPSVNRFCIAGLGEPTLCSQFVEIINFLTRNKMTVGIITNGTNISKFQALDDEPEYISISLYGYNNESYLKYTGKRLFDKVIENFKKIKHSFSNIGFSYIVHKENFRDLDELAKLCDTLMPDFLDLHNYLAYDPHNLMEISKIITTRDKEIIDYINAVCRGRRYRVSKPAVIDLDKPKLKCGSYNFLINLDGDGNIGGCQRHIPPSQTFGNIYTDDDPYNSSEMIKYRKKIHKKSYIHEECTFCFGNFCDQ